MTKENNFLLLSGKTILFLTWFLLVAAVGGFLGFYFSSKALNNEIKEKNNSIQSLQEEMSTLSNNSKVLVFFSKHPESDENPQKTFSVTRSTNSPQQASFAIQQLLIGPTAAETSQGYFRGNITLTGNSTCADSDFALNISDKVATLQFCRTTSLSGIMSDAQLENTIKDTLKQFKNVEKVIILNKNGDCLFDLSGLNLCKQ